MSGDSQRNEEHDFLDDDFVIEDLAGKNDDLEQLFETPPAAAARPGQPATPATPPAPDSEDVLFTDHTAELQPSETFPGKGEFAEDAKSDWGGAHIDLDADEPAASDPAAKEELAAAEAAFTEELGDMLAKDSDDEELSLDSDDELELVDGPSADGISELEQSGTFVLEEEQRDAEPVTREVAKAIWEAVKDPAMAEAADADAAVVEEGWEALPETNVDQLSEVGEVERTDELPPDPNELAELEGHDIYGEEQNGVLVGAPVVKHRRFALFASLAASLALISGAAVVVMRPEWVGLQLEAERLQMVQIERPRVEVVVAAPAALPVKAPQLGAADPATPPATPTTPTLPADPSVPTGPATGTDPVAVLPAPSGTTTEPTAATTPATPVAAEPALAWPTVTETRPLAPSGGVAVDPRQSLVRVGDNTMLGEFDGTAPLPSTAPVVEGVMPGTRAFAQLHNGNYFIGAVKVVDADRVTLRLAQGEVTLVHADLARLTALGSADYEALQKATSGFVRLTNSNKLVGGILSSIADDHIVLEFRSNRVMLPRSAVGSIVQGEPQQEVRLGTTREEDVWVRALAERQLGQANDGPGAAPTTMPPAPLRAHQR